MYCIENHPDEDSWHEWDCMIKDMKEYRKEIIETLNKEFGGSNGQWVGMIMAQNYIDKLKEKYHISVELWETFGFLKKEAYAILEDGEKYFRIWKSDLEPSFDPNE